MMRWPSEASLANREKRTRKNKKEKGKKREKVEHLAGKGGKEEAGELNLQKLWGRIRQKWSDSLTIGRERKK